MNNRARPLGRGAKIAAWKDGEEGGGGGGRESS